MRSKLCVLGLVCCVGGGCASSYIYRPVGRATVQMPIGDGGEVPAAIYAVPGPGGSTQGEVRVAALGVRAFEGGHRHELGVRVQIENRSGDLWFVDVLHQLLVSADGAQVPPNHVHRPARGVSGSPLTAIEPRSMVQVEYFFPVTRPADRQPNRFTLAWSLWTPARLLALRTSFARDENHGEGPATATDDRSDFPYPDGASPFASTAPPLGPSWAQRPPKFQQAPVTPPPAR